MSQPGSQKDLWPPKEKGGRLLYSIEEIAAALSVSRRTLEREIASQRFPKPDLRIGRMPRWKTETVVNWVEKGGAA